MVRSKITLISILALLAIAASVSLLEGCGSSATSSSATTFTQVYSQVIVSASCATCHSQSGSAWSSGDNLDLSSQAAAYSSLTSLGVTASDRSCSGVKLVVAGSPSTSYMATVLFSDYYQASNYQVAGCSPYSAHQNDQNFSASDEATVIGWITGGALNN